MNPRLISIKSSDKRAWIYPEQGFQLHGFEQDFGKSGGVSAIYAPDTPIEPPDRRYGNPILFPNPSRACSKHGIDTWIWKDKALSMPFHGFARNLYWHLLEVKEDRITGELVPNSSAQVTFPFDCKLKMTYRLDQKGLILDAEVINAGSEDFPYALGFHPYLRAPLGSKGNVSDIFVDLPNGAQIQSKDEWKSCTTQNFKAQRIKGNDINLKDSIVLIKTQTSSLELHDPINKMVAKVSVEESQQSFSTWVIWNASPTAPYICLEPWTDYPNALNRSGTRSCPAGQIHHYQMIISTKTI